jgi:hypothetical protein
MTMAHSYRPAPRAALALHSLALLLLAGACASAPQVLRLGDAPDLGATLSLVDSATPPVNLEVELTQPAHVVVLHVVPGAGASLVYPRDTSQGPTHFLVGKHRIRAWYPGRGLRTEGDSLLPTARDSLLDIRRPTLPDSLDRTRGGRTRTTAGDRVEDPRERQPRNVPSSYLLLVATPARLHPDTVRRRVEGVTIPLNEMEALNAMGKLVRSTAQPGATWAGHAVPIRLSAGGR